jgi:8-oxo-dGTP pyrophosphatase MutT (NUDIX family)
MTDLLPSFEHPSSLSEYAVNAAEYLRQHPEYDVLCTGAVAFDKHGKLLIVQRAANELAFPNMWVGQWVLLAAISCSVTNTSQEIPGGKVDDTDKTLLDAAVRELKEETGLTAARVCRKVTDFTFGDERPGKPPVVWLKIVFEVEVQDMDVTLDPAEHQQYLFVSEEEVANDRVGDVELAYISPTNKAVKLEAFRLQKETVPT